MFGLQTGAMGPGKSDVFLRYKFGGEGKRGRPLVIREVTACYRFRLSQYREAGSMFLSYAYSDTMDNALLFCKLCLAAPTVPVAVLFVSCLTVISLSILCSWILIYGNGKKMGDIGRKTRKERT